MRRYGESPEKAVQTTIEEYKRAAGFIKPLRDTLDKYAGKVYNKRFLGSFQAIFIAQIRAFIFVQVYKIRVWLNFFFKIS